MTTMNVPPPKPPEPIVTASLVAAGCSSAFFLTVATILAVVFLFAHYPILGWAAILWIIGKFIWNSNKKSLEAFVKSRLPS